MGDDRKGQGKVSNLLGGGKTYEQRQTALVGIMRTRIPGRAEKRALML
jgi:hypothetical protein